MTRAKASESCDAWTTICAWLGFRGAASHNVV